MSMVNSIHFFSGDLPDAVPMATLPEIRKITAGFHADRLEVYVDEPGNNQGYFVTALVLLNKDRDEGYYFRGLGDAEGYHIAYPAAWDVVDALRKVADESRVELDILLGGEGMKFSCEPGNFFDQLRERGPFYWRKNSETKLLDTAPIPTGGRCLDCPYHQIVPGKPEQRDGYCRFLNFGDWMAKLGFSLLWDDLKACQIKRD